MNFTIVAWVITTVVSIIAIVINRKDKQLEKKSQIIDNSAKNITSIIINNNYNITPEIARKIKDEAEFISSTTSSTIALAEARIKAIRGELSGIKKKLEGLEGNKEEK